jgi:uncharacterized membrane protein YgcG
MRAFEIHKPKQAPPPAPTPERRRRRRWLLALLFLLLVGGIGLAVRPDPKVARAKALQDELFANRPSGPPTPESRAKMDELRQVMSSMTRDQKDQLFAPMREKMKADFNNYFTMSPKEKQQVLDQQIDREEKWKKEREKSGKTNTGGKGGSPGGGGGPGGGGPKTPDQVKDRSKQRLDNSSPEDRAKRDQFRKDMENRRKQRGLAPGGR